jgi:class 3 adenylate cyclase
MVPPDRYPFGVALRSGTRYARSGEADIAYQVFGEGPADLLLYTGWSIPIDCVDDEPAMARFHRRLGSFSRVIRFDTRGVGLSDRGSVVEPPTSGEWAEDALAVLDAVGSERATVLAPYGSSGAGITLAATQPGRVSGLIVINGTARAAWAPDYLGGIPEGRWDLSTYNEPDAVERGYDVLALVAPSVAGDPLFRAWWDRAGNLGTTPAMAQVLWQSIYKTDVRDQLHLIHMPALILERVGSPLFGSAHGRYLVDHISGARYVELPGADMLYWVGDTRQMLDEIEEFVTGVRGGSGSERVLATVLFTDIVGSTSQAATLGDGPWRDLLDRHDRTVRAQIERFRGRVIKSVGDGFVASFDSPGRAIECAGAIRQTLGTFDLAVRAGVHTGEIEIRGDDIAGLAVHIGARISASAGPGEIMVSSTVKDLVAGSAVEFEDRGERELRGVPGTWRLFAVRS